MAVVPVAVRPMGFKLITPVRDARMVTAYARLATSFGPRLIVGPTIFESLMREEENRVSYIALKTVTS